MNQLLMARLLMHDGLAPVPAYRKIQHCKCVNNVIFPNNYVTFPGVNVFNFGALPFITHTLESTSNGKRRKKSAQKN
jgi:hypothetical protein